MDIRYTVSNASARGNIPEITLKLSPAEARALHSCLDNELWTLREHGVGADELPRYYVRLERVQRLVADGLTYLHPARSA